jgi:hypothetical protein
MKIAPTIAPCLLALASSLVSAQEDFPEPPEFRGGPPPGGPQPQERKILAQFDQNSDQRLDLAERSAALAFLKQNPAPNRGGGPPGGMRGFGGGPDRAVTPPTPGQRITPADVEPAANQDLYAANTLRTLFLDFENADWEAELEAFHGTDVEVPATLTVDGKRYPGVGVHFRGMSSYMMVGTGRKRSFNVALDFTDKKQRLGGVKTLNLLNSNGDGSFLSAVLFSQLARKHLPAPRVNLVRVVINGENWGVYANQEQFNKEFVKHHFGNAEGARWKVPGSPGGRGGLEYLGDDLAPYRQRYTMKADDDDDWHALVRLCKTLVETPADHLEAALTPILDLDGALWFLALDCTLINSDGYWTRASDYCIYRDPKGRFHLIPGDMNEAFRAAEGGPGGGPPRGMRPDRLPGPAQPGAESANATPREFPFPPPDRRLAGGPRAEGVKLDPLVALDDASKPLRARLLAVPALRERYLAKVRQLAEEDLAWQTLGPVVAGYRNLIAKEVAADTRKLSTTEEFLQLTADAAVATPAAAPAGEPSATRGGPRGPGGHGGMALRAFADQRRAFLLADPRVKPVTPEVGATPQDAGTPVPRTTARRP